MGQTASYQLTLVVAERQLRPPPLRSYRLHKSNSRLLDAERWQLLNVTLAMCGFGISLKHSLSRSLKRAVARAIRLSPEVELRGRRGLSHGQVRLPVRIIRHRQPPENILHTT